MKLCLRLPSFHKLKSTTSLSFYRKFHGPPKSEEYTAVAEYPEIPQFKNVHEKSYAELKNQIKSLDTGKSLSEALIFASTNPQYDDRLFIFHENCKLRIPAEHVVYTNVCFSFVLTFRTIHAHNMF